jgi:membrane-bound lytic murein transglycosylase D
LVAQLQNIPESARRTFLVHEVRKGETLNKIAKKYGVTVYDLADANNISTKSKLYVGVPLRIPVLINPNENNYSYNTDIAVAKDNGNKTDQEYVSPYTSLNGKGNNEEVPEVKEVDKSLTETNSEIEEKIVATVETEEKESIGTVDAFIPDDLAPVNYRVKKDDSLLGIADIFDIRVSDVRNWNNIPYTSSIKVGQNLTLYVPADNKDYYASLDKSTEVEEKAPKVYSDNSTESYIYHTIRRGENLGLIATQYGVSIAAIKEWNDLNNQKIIAGKKLKIYTDESYTPNVSDISSNNTKGSVYYYKVRKGDTISQISERYHVSTAELKKWNGIKSNKIISGQTLKVYATESTSSFVESSTTPSANINYHKIKKGETIGSIAELYKVSAASIRDWNDLNSDKIVSGKTLKIYSNDSPVVVSKNVSTSTELSSEAINHQIQPGETIIAIAGLYGVSVEEIKRWNNLRSSRIIAGKSLVIYSNGDIKTAPTTTVIKSGNDFIFHKVKKGETIGSIAENYKVGISSIRQWNNISGNKIIAGQDLKIKKSSGSDYQKPKEGFHVVEKGESLYSIAIKYNTSVQKLKTLNNLSDSRIIAGQKLKVG